jgi:hypothetical protein
MAYAMKILRQETSQNRRYSDRCTAGTAGCFFMIKMSVPIFSHSENKNSAIFRGMILNPVLTITAGNNVTE